MKQPSCGVNVQEELGGGGVHLAVLYDTISHTYSNRASRYYLSSGYLRLSKENEGLFQLSMIKIGIINHYQPQYRALCKAVAVHITIYMCR